MARTLTKKQKGFVKDYLDTGNGTQSALNHYDIQGKDPEKIASVIATQNLDKLSVREAIESHAESAESMVYKLSQTADGEMVRLNASKDILDRAGYQAIIKTESKNVNITVTAKELEIAQEYEAKLKEQL